MLFGRSFITVMNEKHAQRTGKVIYFPLRPVYGKTYQEIIFKTGVKVEHFVVTTDRFGREHAYLWYKDRVTQMIHHANSHMEKRQVH